MPQNIHRLVGVIDLSAAWEFEAAEPHVNEPLPIACLDDGMLPSRPQEQVLQADVSQLFCELGREYEELVVRGKSSELVVL